MANDKDAKDTKAVSQNEQKDAKSTAQARVAEIKRKKAEAKRARDSDTSSHDESDQDAKSSAQARVAEIKRKKAEARNMQDAGVDPDDAKSAAQARVAELKRKKEKAKQAEGSGSPKESDGDHSTDDAKTAREKKIAEMREKARAKKQAKENGEEQETETQTAKPKSSKSASAIAKARAAKAKKEKAKQQEEQKPSPNQPLLDQYVKVIHENVGKDVFEDSYINRLAKDVPTLVAKPETYYKVAEFLKYNEQLAFDYLSQIQGVDFETHMEIYVHLFSFRYAHAVALKVKIDRKHPEIDSLVPLWAGANWPEREVYDLLGITFRGHPNCTRIMMPDDWVGHPLRKDYEPYDVEV